MSEKIPRFQPTDDQRRLVAFMAACGHPISDICPLITHPATGLHIGPTMLKDVFSTELRSGGLKHLVAVEENVFRMALKKDDSQVALRAAMFVLRSKAGWKEGVDINVCDTTRVIEGAQDTLQSKIAKFTGTGGGSIVPFQSHARGS